MPPPSMPPPAERVAQRALTYPLRLAGLQSCHVRTSYGRFHYYDSAPGSHEPPAVLLHGLGALGVSLFALSALLRRKRRVVVPDLFQFAGLSEPLWGGFDTEDHLDAILELIHGLHVDTIDVCGHSAGGGAAILVAVRLPQKVTSLALLNPGGLSHDFQGLRDDILSIHDAEGARRVYDALGAGGVFRLPIVRTLGARAIGSMFTRPGVRDYLGTIRSFDFVDSVFRDIQCPTLLLWGDEDRLLSPRIAKHIAAHTPDIRAFWVKGASHLLPIDDPYTVYDHLLRFWGIERRSPRAVRGLVSRIWLRPSVPIEIEAESPRAVAAE